MAPENDAFEARRLIISYLHEHPEVLNTPASDVIILQLGECTLDLQVQFWVNTLAKKEKGGNNLGIGIRSQVIGEVKSLLEESGFEMPSKVLEHKMYRDQVIKHQVQ